MIVRYVEMFVLLVLMVLAVVLIGAIAWIALLVGLVIFLARYLYLNFFDRKYLDDTGE